MTDTDGLRQQIADALLTADAQDRRLDGYKLDVVHRYADAVLPVVTAWAEQQARQRAAEELAELGRLLAFTPLSQRTSGVTSDYTQGMHAAGQMAASRADALTAEDPS